MTNVSAKDLREKLTQFLKIDLIHLPTPLTKLENLTKTLGGPEIYIKRDDLTGLAFGGNKSRKLQYIMRDVLDKKCDAIITWASLQSNWCLQTAATARKFGITPILLLYKSDKLPLEYNGNLLLDYILDADIRIRNVDERKAVKLQDAEAAVEEIMKEARETGYSPYYIPIGGSMVGGSMKKPFGAIGCAEAFLEIIEQTQNQGVKFNYILHATASGGTQAGLTVAAKALGGNVRILGVSVSEGKNDLSKKLLQIARDTINLLNLNVFIDYEDFIVSDDYIQDGYGVLTREVAEAIEFVAVHEGIFLDPVYTGKAMHALIDLVKKNKFSKNDKIIFYHTGGTPALFPSLNQLKLFLKK